MPPALIVAASATRNGPRSSACQPAVGNRAESIGALQTAVAATATINKETPGVIDRHATRQQEIELSQREHPNHEHGPSEVVDPRQDRTPTDRGADDLARGGNRKEEERDGPDHALRSGSSQRVPTDERGANRRNHRRRRGKRDHGRRT